MSRKKLTLTDSQVTELQELIKAHPDERIGVRASMVLDVGTGMTGESVAAKYSERPCTVSFWKSRYADSGIAGLLNRPRGRTRDGYGQDFPDRLESTVHSAPPDGTAAWNVSSLSEHLGVPKYGIQRHLKKLGINLEAQNFLLRHQNDNASGCDSSGTFPQTVSVGGCAGVESGEPHDDSHMLNVSLIVVVTDKTGRQVMMSRSDLGAILADPEHFDVSTLAGFRRDYGMVEQGMINGFADLLGKFSDAYTAEVSKKKIELNPELPSSVHTVMSEMGMFNMLTVGELSAGLQPKQIILSEAQESLALQAVSDAGGSYRTAAAQLNRYQHRHEGNAVQSRYLDYLATRTGKAIFDNQIRMADTILDEAGINPKTMRPRKDGVLESIIKLPAEEDKAKKEKLFQEIIKAYNNDLDDFAQIKDMELIFKTELLPENTMIICLDEIGVKHQREKRRRKGKEPEGKAKSSKWVETTSIHIQEGSNVYRMAAPTMKEGFKLALAFALEHGMKKGLNIIFFYDGARNIRASIDKYFAFYPYISYIDWYHVRKKVRELSSSAFTGTFEEKRQIVQQICTRLWAGNVKEAFSYIDAQPARNDNGVKKLKGYLDGKKPLLYCYALRKELGYRNASSQVEKTNDLLVARRQKHNGMSWGYQGSCSLASITSLRHNDEFDEWLQTRHIRFGFAPGA